MIKRVWKYTPGVFKARLAFAVVAGAIALAHACGVGAAEPGFTAQFHDHTYVWPIIGTEAYSAGCTLTHWWEDGSAVAYCPEDGETYLYDPDGQPVAGVPGNPVRAAGWYVAPELWQVGPGA